MAPNSAPHLCVSPSYVCDGTEWPPSPFLRAPLCQACSSLPCKLSLSSHTTPEAGGRAGVEWAVPGGTSTQLCSLLAWGRSVRLFVPQFLLLPDRGDVNSTCFTDVSASSGRHTKHLRQGGLNNGIDFSQCRRLGGLASRCLEVATISPVFSQGRESARASEVSSVRTLIPRRGPHPYDLI